MGGRQLKAVAVTRAQQFCFTTAAAMPDGTDGVDDMTRRQLISPRDACFSGRASAEATAFVSQAPSGGAVNGAVDATTTQQGTVGRIDYGIYGEPGNIALANLHVQHRSPFYNSALSLAADT